MKKKLKVKIRTINKFEKRMEIPIPWESVKEEYNDLIKEYSRLPLKGFRPGKVPVSAIESIYQNQIKSDLAMRCSPRFFRKAIEENKLNNASPVELINIDLIKDEYLILTGSFVNMPDFRLPNYSRLYIRSTEEKDQLNEISEKLLNLTDISVPPQLIMNELNYTEAGTEIDEEAKEDATDRIKLLLIIKKIAHQDGIEINEQDVEERIKILAEKNDTTPDEVKSFLLANDGVTRLTDSILAEHVLKYIISINNQENKEVEEGLELE